MNQFEPWSGWNMPAGVDEYDPYFYEDEEEENED